MFIKSLSIFKEKSVLYTIVNFVSLYVFISSIKLFDFGLYHFILIHVFTSSSLIIGLYLKPAYGKIFDIVVVPFMILALFHIHFFSLLIAILIGLNVPRSLVETMNSMGFEERGVKSAIVLFTIYSIISALSLFMRSLHDSILILAALKFLSFIFAIRKSEGQIHEDYVKSSPIIKLSFLTLWFVFIFIDALSTKILVLLGGAPTIFHNIVMIIGLISIIIIGIYIDRFGRKIILLASYVYLGIIYAIVSITEKISLIILEGIVWGPLTLLFLMVIWGDICSIKERNIFVTLSIIIVLLNRTMIVLFPTIIGLQQLFSFISLFLFVSAFIILLTPETLPESIRRKRELSSYIRKVKKIKEKYA